VATRKPATAAPAPATPRGRAAKAKEPPQPPAKPARKRAAKAKSIYLEYEEVEVPQGKDAVLPLTGFEPAPVADAHAQLTPWQIEIGLTPTSVPGIYKNKAGVLVDGDGVMVDYATVKNADQERFEKILGGPVDSPAKLLKAVALDPQLPLNTRISAATSAAPYFDRKKPVGIDGGEDGKPIQMEVIHRLPNMAQAELDALEQLLIKGAVALELGEDGVYAPEGE
jgi:hypothetical protein